LSWHHPKTLKSGKRQMPERRPAAGAHIGIVSSLFAPQRNHGIHPSGAPSRNGDCKPRDQYKHEWNSGKGWGIGCSNAELHAASLSVPNECDAGRSLGLCSIRKAKHAIGRETHQ
jgi:hypothetical protein